ncbi:MAG: hypothetical protein WCL44_12125 [bacterium]
MFQDMIKGLLGGIVTDLLSSYRRLITQLFRIEAARYYLHGVQMARLSAIGLMLIGLLIGFISIGIVLFHAGLFILLPWSLETKAVLAMIMGLTYMTIGGIALRNTLSEKTWMEKSGAATMIEEATRLSGKD